MTQLGIGGVNNLGSLTLTRTRTRTCLSVCNALQSGIGGVDSWGSLPLIQYRLTLKKPIRFAFAIQPFGMRNVGKLPSLLQKSRREQERRRIDLSSHSTHEPAEEAEDPTDLQILADLRRSASGGLSGVSTPVRALSPPPAAAPGGGTAAAAAAVVPSSLARSLRLRVGPKVGLVRRVRSFDGTGTVTPAWLGSGMNSPVRGSSPDVDEGSELIGGSWATAAAAVRHSQSP
jgi:hypothetical protein